MLPRVTRYVFLYVWDNIDINVTEDPAGYLSGALNDSECSNAKLEYISRVLIFANRVQVRMYIAILNSTLMASSNRN